MTDSRPVRDGITLESRTLSHYFVVRRVAELVGSEPVLHSLRREWLVELTRGKLAAVWNGVLSGVRHADGGAAWEVVLLEDRGEEVNAVLKREPGGARDVVRIQVAPNAICAWLYGNETRLPLVVEAIEQSIRGIARVGEPDQVAVRFWHRSSGDAVEQMRRVQCPTWDSIAANYPGCDGSLAWLMRLQVPWEHGRLVFWHGPPGSGKTWALRALVREWGQMSPEVITDPDEFFASNAYLQQVLLAEPPTLARVDERFVQGQDRPRLFIVEDAPQLVLQESRAAQGTRMANLLSMTDGILGQGLRVVFVITTNEKIHRVDPAIRRPGRCLQELELPSLTREQAAEWLAANGRKDAAVSDEHTLAELYELVQRRDPPPRHEPSRMGFAG